MTEKLLDYDRNVVPQETGWWCGPASTQIVLNAKGIYVPEREIAAQVEEFEHPGRADDQDGTDYIGLIERLLDTRARDARYTVVEIANDPPTATQVETFRNHLRMSIDGGWGVVMNWIAPPSNYPRGVKGSASPRYGGGTIFHYTAAMGHDFDLDAVWVADPGFWPGGYWISIRQCVSLIAGKGYCFADTGVAAPANDVSGAAILSRAMGASLTLEEYATWLPEVSQSLSDCECRTVERAAMWLAQNGHESGGGRYRREIASGAEYEGRCDDLGNCSPGDGVRFAGRGIIQVTGKSNYAKLSKWMFDRRMVPTPTYFVDNPEKLETVEYATDCVAWYWLFARPDINTLADVRDLVAVTRRINGGTNGLDDRRRRYDRCLAMGPELLKLLDNTSGGISMADANSLIQQFAGFEPDGKTPLRGSDGADYRRVDWLNEYDGPENPEVPGPHPTRSLFDIGTLLGKLFGRVYHNRHGQKLTIFDMIVGIYQVVGEPKVVKGPVTPDE